VTRRSARFAVALAAFALIEPLCAALRPVGLRCEYLIDPVGIDVTAPRLSWLLEASDPHLRGQRQEAYRIMVASSRGKLEDGRADLWDTGRVESNRTIHVAYAGRPLRSGQECWWQVRVWDEDGRTADWSMPGRWSVGLLPGEDETLWRAKWIGCDAPDTGTQTAGPEPDLRTTQWIWLPGRNARKRALAGTAYFRKALELPPDCDIRNARLRIAADDQFEVFLNGDRVGQSDGREDAWQRPLTVDLATRLKPGPNVFAVSATNAATSPAGLAAEALVQLADGTTRSMVTDSSWLATGEETAGWQRPDVATDTWARASALGAVGIAPWGDAVVRAPEQLRLPPPPYLRHEFAVAKPVERAVVYVSALGVCDLRINGRSVTQDRFVPGWSHYPKRVYYRTYDVTALLNQGQNAIGAILADGWYAGYLGFKLQRNRYGGEPRLSAQLVIRYADGTGETVVSDDSWRAAYGPIRESDMQMGETCDARIELPGWDRPGLDDRGWQPVVVSDAPDAALSAHPGPPIRAIMEIPSRAVTETAPGVYLFDLGQNMPGWVRLKARGTRGRHIVMRFGEALNKDGSVHRRNLRSARCIDRYILRGDDEDVWEPRFTYRGFRYVEVTGLEHTPTVDTITGIVAHSAMPETGRFDCSDPRINRLWQNVVWGQRSNFFEVPTDCPQRDERLGWTGDAQVFVPTAAYNMDVAAFFGKWMVDLADSQHANGVFPHVAPDVLGNGGSPAWSDAGIVVPYQLHRIHGDTRIVEQHVDAMSRHLDFLAANSTDGIRPATGYGDWLAPGADTPKDVIATAYYAQVAACMAEMSEAVGRTAEADACVRLARGVRTAFNSAFVSDDGRIKGDTQTAYLLALAFDLLPNNLRQKALAHLVDDIRDRDWRLSTGFVGTPLILPVLSRFGRADVAYRLLLQDKCPSWLYPVGLGATTIWERWDGYTEEQGPHSDNMNSFNHVAFGVVGEWLFSGVCGIRAAKPGFEHVDIHPCIGQGLTHARAEYGSVRGKIVSGWRVADERLTLDVTIPPNVSAAVYVPAADSATILENGVPAEEATGVMLSSAESGVRAYAVGSGTYRFEVCPPPASAIP